MILPRDKRKIINRLWLKYSYVVGRLVQKAIWQHEGIWHPSLVNQLQDEFPEIDPNKRTVHVFINKARIDISSTVEEIIYRCSRARRFIDTIGADYNDFQLEKAQRLAKELIVKPLIEGTYVGDAENRKQKKSNDNQSKQDLED
ncbi:MAG: hypothetical protein ACFFC7_06565 [Candidatus Hermodarchaeota archaeon]